MFDVLLGVFVAVFCFFAFCCGKIPPYTGIIISFLGKPWRSHGPGFFFRVPFFETVDEEVSLRQRALIIEGDFETADEELIRLKISVEYHPWYGHLCQYVLFDEKCDGKMIEGVIKERLRSIFSSVVRTCRNSDEVMDNLKLIAEMVKSDFESATSENGYKLQEYYGVNIETVVISDPELPLEVKEEAARRDAMVKANETRRLEAANKRKMDKLEMKSIENMARDLVAASTECGGKMNYETALTAVQINTGKIKKDIKQVEIGVDTLTTIREVGPALVSALKGGAK